MADVLILGGYGNFGKRIAAALVRHHIPVIVAGRVLAKAQALCAALGPLARPLTVDIRRDLPAVLASEKPSVAVHTCGPFQGADYSVARACLLAGIPYIDLADGRDFVRDFSSLDAEARTAGVTLVTGASTVPGLSSAVLAHHRDQFATLDAVDFGISPGQRAERGLATARAIMTYVGKPLRPFAGHAEAFGWQNLRSQTYPVMGKRLFANCDIPDLDLLPQPYGLSSIRFGAGLELGFMHIGLWAMSWLVRWGLPLNLPALAQPLLTVSNLFNGLGSDVGGMHVIMSGTDHDGRTLSKTWFIVAEQGDGPQIPCVPAILLAKRLHEKGPGRLSPGAYPCVGLISLEDYLEELKPFAISTY